MATVSVNFNTATDNLDAVIATVEHIFQMSETLAPTSAPAATNAGAVALSPEPAAATPNFDAAGLPWDARIHAASQALTSKGIWRAKVGIDPQVKLAVENELRAANPNTVQPAPAPAVAAPAPAVALPVIPNMPALPVMAPVETSYQKLARFIAEQVEKGSINNDWVAQALAAYQVPGGQLPNAAAMADADVANILAGFKAALGVA